MFIQLMSNDPLFSYKIVKNPNNIYKKNITEERTVTAWFPESKIFVAKIENSDKLFIEKLRGFNADTYVSALQYVVTPHNMQLFSTVFTSVLAGSVGDKNLTLEQFNSLESYQMYVGPFADFSSDIKDVLEEKTGMNIGTIPIGTISFLIFTATKTTITKFLQDVYVSCYVLSANTDIFNIFKSKNKQEQLLKYAPWLGEDDDVEKIIKKLSRYKKDVIAKAAKVFDQEIEEKTTLHMKRLQLAAEAINIAAKEKPISVLDLGCGNAQLLDFLERNSNISYLGLEKNPRRVFSKIKQTDILAPIIYETDLQPDFLILSEVVEHLTAEERKKLFYLIETLYQPKKIFLSTPNVEYNVNYGLVEGEYRHNDHKIEFNNQQFMEQIVDPLIKMGYIISLRHVLPDENIQPSFVIFAEYYNQEDRIPDYKQLKEFQSRADPIFLPFTGQKISRPTLEKGLTNDYIENAFFYGPTIAPVDYSEKYPNVLEHIQTAFDYYEERGVNEVIVEEKVMGSRAYILAHRNPRYSEDEQLIFVKSRSNRDFFDNDSELLKQIHQEIFANLPEEIQTVALDCEITPWALKAKKLIEKKFLLPGEAAFYHKLALGEFIQNEKKFLDTLDIFTQEEELKITVFDILFYADKTIHIQYLKDNTNELIDRWFSNLDTVAPVKHYLVSLSDADSRTKGEQFMNSFANGEGVVVKPKKKFQLLDNGFPLQPALKVRNKDYLRIIYGINYLDNLEFLSQRNIKRKRQQAATEYELAINILLTLNSPHQQKRFLAAFAEIDNESLKYIDATL